MKWKVEFSDQQNQKSLSITPSASEAHALRKVTEEKGGQELWIQNIPEFSIVSRKLSEKLSQNFKVRSFEVKSQDSGEEVLNLNIASTCAFGAESLKISPDIPSHLFRKNSTQNKTFKLKSPMSGKVIALLVEDGQQVEQGQDLIVIEAMKMENRIPAPRPGVVDLDSDLAVGQNVNVDQMILTIN